MDTSGITEMFGTRTLSDEAITGFVDGVCEIKDLV
jgi:hypothetical protein